jgi:membrane protease YdiL (CAAX protease family)
MTDSSRYQTAVFAAFLVAYALLVFVASSSIPLGQRLLPVQVAPGSATGAPRLLEGLTGAGLVFAIYGPLGTLGAWFARKCGLPGIIRRGATWRQRYVWPALLGIELGCLVVVIDRLFVATGTEFRLPHPGLPFSLGASACAALGEEMIFRLFAMTFIAFLLSRMLKHREATPQVL